jgi:multiple sugar transport system permease protein
MRNTRSRKITGFLLLTPALGFVLAFTAYPFLHMMWMSLHSWSIIEPKKYVGFRNFVRIFDDGQFWVSLGFTLKYTLWITPILMVLGFLIALLTAANTPIKRFTRGVVFVPVVIGLGVSSLLWYWLFSYDFGLINRALLDVGLIAKPIVWFGVSAELVMWAVIVSVVWKVVGFGMLLFVAAIQSIPQDINDAAKVDGARYWMRVRKITLPMTLKTILLVTLVSIIGSLLAFDQFYIMTAGQPHNATATSVFWVYLNSFPYLKLGYGSALSFILALIVLACTIVQMMLTRRSYG